MRSVVNPQRQQGAQVVEYALLVSVISIALALALPQLGNGVCELNNRVGGMLGAGPFFCAANGGDGNGGTGNSGAGNNGGGNNTGSGNNGGGNNAGGGTNGGGNNNGGGNGPGGNGRP